MDVATTFPDDQAWQAVLDRDRSCDGQFVFGVLTTGIFCRPSCPARRPKRENVRLFASAVEAEAAGLRACKRCRPNEVSREGDAVARAAQMISASHEPLASAELAAAVGYSPTHFQRVFTRALGISPAAYSRALREDRVRDSLRGADTVTEALYDAGYAAPSRFYDEMKGKMGMTASDWRAGGRGRTIHWTTVETSLGPMLVAATELGVCCLSFGEGEKDLRARFPQAELAEGGVDFAALFDQVVSAVERPGTGPDIPLDIKGTVFQQRVWSALREIPPGETRSYGELAATLGNPKASRAVGGANGANNIAVLIPCHRVIAADGSLGGYAYGEDIKRELLKREGVSKP